MDVSSSVEIEQESEEGWADGETGELREAGDLPAAGHCGMNRGMRENSQLVSKEVQISTEKCYHGFLPEPYLFFLCGVVCERKPRSVYVVLCKAQKEHAAELTFSYSEIANFLTPTASAKLPDGTSGGKEGGVKAKA